MFILIVVIKPLVNAKILKLDKARILNEEGDEDISFLKR